MALSWFTVLVGVVAVERLSELLTARRNASWSFAHGGAEYGRGHYPAMVVLHTGLLVGALAEAWLSGRAFIPVLGWTMFAIVIAAQALRRWCMATLGPQWNTRVLVVPGAPRVSRGPYRFLRHPNYVAVVAEGFALPLVHTAWITAVLFTLLNALLLRVRIGVEERALTSLFGIAT